MMGRFLTDYHGVEEVTYHLFPSIPYLMPVTVSLGITALVTLGLQPSHSLKISLDVTFTSLLSIFVLFGLYHILMIDNEITLSIKTDAIDKIPEGAIFFLQPFLIKTDGIRKNVIKTRGFLILMTVITILSRFYEQVRCNGIMSCMKTIHNWWEPVTLALTISSIGLCLPDLFQSAQSHLDGSHRLKKMMTSTKYNFNTAMAIGLLSTGLVYFCPISSLVLISSSSILVLSTMQELRILLHIPNHETSQDDLSDYSFSDDSDVEDSGKKKDDSSDTESTCSDISLIVSEYKAQVKIMNGDEDPNEKRLIRMKCLSRVLVAMITSFGVILAYSILYKQLKLTFIALLGLSIFTFLYQLITNRFLSEPDNKVGSGHAFSYLLYILLFFGGMPKHVWLHFIMCNVSGMILYWIYRQRRNLRHLRDKHLISIKETPPVFETTCHLEA